MMKMLAGVFLMILQVHWSSTSKDFRESSRKLDVSPNTKSQLTLTPGMMMPQLTTLDVKCSRSGMSVLMEFDRDFPGVIYSKGHFYDPSCNYVTLADSNKDRKKFVFNIPMEGCGTTGQLDHSSRDQDMYLENTIIIQNDALIQEVWDEARNIRCTWQHTIQKSVKFTPFKVYEAMKVPVQLDKRSINTLMEIQKGTGPFSSPVTGYVHMGDDTSVVIYVQDPSQTLDANVISCSASSAGGEKVELVDSRGCIKKPELLTQFSKTRNTNGVEADLMLYSYLKAFRIGESPEFIISCNLEVCEGKCSAPCADGRLPSRNKRQAQDGSMGPSVVTELQRGVIVLSKDQYQENHQGCLLTSVMLIGAATTLCIVLFLSTLSCFLVFKIRNLRCQLHEKQHF